MEEDFKVIIVDDEPEARDLLITLLDEYPNMHVMAQVGSVDEAIGHIAFDSPDLIFLDIHMPKKSGFELAEALHNLKINSQIIFVTAYDQYAIQAVKHAAFDYLLKPINEEEFRKAITRFQSVKKTKTDMSKKMETLLKTINNKPRLRFYTRNGFIFIILSEIIFMKAEGNYTKIYLLNGKEETVTQNLGQLEEELSANDFFRVNRSVIINLKFLDRVNRRTKVCHIATGIDEFEFPIPPEQIKILETLDY
ncbi:MAG: LytTR family DNA-binding domain-containing protein [Bacteroidota bacterium]|nr:LytTR family DNA-binding domain-containing protein [Bacteroidota bacterium]